MFTLNPSIYYSSERGASELVAGALVNARITGYDKKATSLIIGAHYRYQESIIGSVGIQFGGLKDHGQL